MSEQIATWLETPVTESAFTHVRAALVSAVGRIVTHLPRIPRDDDPEHVHQVRVGSRRTRTLIDGFRPLLDDVWIEDVETRMRDLCRGLGRVRDADILISRLQESSARLLIPADAKGLIRVVQRRRADRRRQVDDRLQRGDLLNRVSALASVAADVGPRTGTAPLEGAVVGLAAVAWHDLRACVEAAGIAPSTEVLHQVRIKTKHARYLGEAVAPIVGDPVVTFVSAAAGLQTILGSVQDAAITIEHLEREARDGGKRRAFVAGQLAQVESEQLRKAVAKWPAAWDRVLESAS